MSGPTSRCVRDIDDNDRRLLRLLLEDTRRPFSELAAAIWLAEAPERNALNR